MKGGKAGRKRRSTGSDPAGGDNPRSNPKKRGGERPPGVAPKKGSAKKPGFGGTSTSRED
jgi:hypothetical protein